MLDDWDRGRENAISRENVIPSMQNHDDARFFDECGTDRV